MLFNPAPQHRVIDAEASGSFDSCVVLIYHQADGVQFKFLRIFLSCVHVPISSYGHYPLTGLCRSIRPPHLNNLRPASVQSLLEACTSVKVKRLFLYLADKAGHDWHNYLKLEKVDLGSGKRSIVKDGVYVSQYQITVPKELEADHG